MEAHLTPPIAPHRRYVSLPESFQQRGLPESFLKHWPVATDGLRLWNVFNGYVRQYLDIFYPEGDAQVGPTPACVMTVKWRD